jgi:hypothetical protein
MNDWSIFFTEMKDQIERRKFIFEELENKRRYGVKL